MLPVHPPTLTFTFFPFWCADATRRFNKSGSSSEPSHPSVKSDSGTANAKSTQSYRPKSTFSGGKVADAQSG